MTSWLNKNAIILGGANSSSIITFASDVILFMSSFPSSLGAELTDMTDSALRNEVQNSPILVNRDNPLAA